MKLRGHRLNSLAAQIFANSLTLTTLFREKVGAKAFQCAVVVVPNVPNSLSAPRRNLSETVPLEEVHVQRSLLLQGELVSQLVQNGLAINLIGRGLRGSGTILLFVEDFDCGALAVPEESSPIEGPVIGHLNDPGRRRTFLRLELVGVFVKVDEYVLPKIVGLGFAP
jgi:hypothetical protein